MIWWIYAFLILLFLIGVAAIIISNRRKMSGLGRKRGVAPDQGDSLVEGGLGASWGGGGGGHQTLTRVSRDPQKYAKGFVPSHARKKK